MFWSRLLRWREGIVGIRRGTPFCRRHSGCAQQSFAIGGFRFDAGWEGRRVLELLRAEMELAALMQTWRVQKVEEGGVLHEEGRGAGCSWCRLKMRIEIGTGIAIGMALVWLQVQGKAFLFLYMWEFVPTQIRLRRAGSVGSPTQDLSLSPPLLLLLLLLLHFGARPWTGHHKWEQSPHMEALRGQGKLCDINIANSIRP